MSAVSARVEVTPGGRASPAGEAGGLAGVDNSAVMSALGAGGSPVAGGEDVTEEDSVVQAVINSAASPRGIR